MARIYKQRYTVLNKRTGKRETRKTKNWYIEYRDAVSGKTVVKPGYKDLKATQQYAADLERTAERIDAGLLTHHVEHARTSIVQLIEEYAEYLVGKGDGVKHVSVTKRRLQMLSTAAGWDRIADLDQSSVLAYLSRCRAGKGPTAEGRAPVCMSRETSNHYVRAVKAFGAWLVSPGRKSAVNPFAGMVMLNSEIDRRRVRRALSEGDFTKLIEATRQRPDPRCQMAGADRVILYTLAAFTGLRLSELASLTPASFQLGTSPPHVLLAARDAKSKQAASIPLPSHVVALLRPWLKGRPVIFRPGPWQAHAARMLRGDLAAAGIPFADPRGRVFDFHSLRSQYATSLARAGVDLRVTQKLMRHSTPLLTVKHYTQLEMEDLAAEVEKLGKRVG